jgi:hypothetical protein
MLMLSFWGFEEPIEGTDAASHARAGHSKLSCYFRVRIEHDFLIFLVPVPQDPPTVNNLRQSSFESAPLSIGRARRRPPTPPRDPAGRHCQMSSPTPQVSTGETARAAAPKPCMLRHAPSNLTFAPTAAPPSPPRRLQDAHCLRQYPPCPYGERGGVVRRGVACGGGGSHKIAGSVVAPPTTARRLPRCAAPQTHPNFAVLCPGVALASGGTCGLLGTPLLPTGGVHMLWPGLALRDRQWCCGSCTVRAVPVPVCSAQAAEA